MTGENRERNAQAELEKSEASLRAAEALAALGLWDDAVSRAYYAAFHAAFHAATALLYSEGLQARTHGGLHDLFFQTFVTTGVVTRALATDLAALQRYREQADYSSAVSFDATSGAEEVARAGSVVTALREVLRGRGVVGGR